MAVSTVSAPAGRTARRAVPAKRAPLSKTAQVAKQTPPVPHASNGASPFEIMAGRIANRVAEMAENVTFVERAQYAHSQDYLFCIANIRTDNFRRYQNHHKPMAP
jgi:hypothetical protein